MKLYKLANNRYRIETDEITYEGTLEQISEFISDFSQIPEEEFDEAICDLSARGNTCAHFGLDVAKCYDGHKVYGFMYSIRMVA